MMLLLAVLEFVCGSLMFSYWLGKAAHKDLSTVGDGNPGAFNLWSAAGYKWGIAGVLLDFVKGYFPLVWIYEAGMLHGYGLVLAAAAPIFGHAFSPFMRFRGGKAIAVTFGVWSALTRFEVALVYAVVLAVLLAVFSLLSKDSRVSDEANGFQVVLGMLLVFIYLYMRGYSFPFLCIGFINLALLVYTNRHKLMSFVKRHMPIEHSN